jgi:hypothetical protein
MATKAMQAVLLSRARSGTRPVLGRSDGGLMRADCGQTVDLSLGLAELLGPALVSQDGVEAMCSLRLPESLWRRTGAAGKLFWWRLRGMPISTHCGRAFGSPPGSASSVRKLGCLLLFL